MLDFIRRAFWFRGRFLGSSSSGARCPPPKTLFSFMASSDRFAAVGVSREGGGLGLGLFSLLEAAAQPSSTRGAVLWAKAQGRRADGAGLAAQLPATVLGELPGARKATRLVRAQDAVAALESALPKATLAAVLGDAGDRASLTALMVRGGCGEATANAAVEEAAGRVSAQQDEAAAVRAELAELLQMPAGEVRLRCARVDGTWLFSRYDCIALLTGDGTERNAAKTWLRMIQEHPEVSSDVPAPRVFKFSGPAQKATPVAGIEGIVEMLLLVPGRRAARFRKAVSKVFVRFFGGSGELIKEVEAAARRQRFLRERCPDHPATAFGEAVVVEPMQESRASSTRSRQAVEGSSKRRRGEAAFGEASVRMPRDGPPALQDERASLCDLAKASGLEGGVLRSVCRVAGPLLLELLRREQPEMTESELKRRCCGGSGPSSVSVPEAERQIADAALLRAQEAMAEEVAGARCLRGPAPAPSSGPAAAAPSERRRRSGYGPEGPEHHAAKDAANARWIELLRRNGCLGGQLFYLDAWRDVEGGRVLRTTEALLRAGCSAQKLFCANPDAGIAARLAALGVQAQCCGWIAAQWDHRPLFDGVYLDLCTGSAAVAASQLERAGELAAARCVLGFTIVERDFEGEAFVVRTLRLNDFSRSRGWAPADGAAAASTLLHRSSHGPRQQVLAQFWARS